MKNLVIVLKQSVPYILLGFLIGFLLSIMFSQKSEAFPSVTPQNSFELLNECYQSPLDIIERVQSTGVSEERAIEITAMLCGASLMDSTKMGILPHFELLEQE